MAQPAELVFPLFQDLLPGAEKGCSDELTPLVRKALQELQGIDSATARDSDRVADLFLEQGGKLLSWWKEIWRQFECEHAHGRTVPGENALMYRCYLRDHTVTLPGIGTVHLVVDHRLDNIASIVITVRKPNETAEFYCRYNSKRRQLAVPEELGWSRKDLTPNPIVWVKENDSQGRPLYYNVEFDLGKLASVAMSPKGVDRYVFGEDNVFLTSVKFNWANFQKSPKDVPF